MPAAKATTPSNDKIQPELCLEDQDTHRRLSLTGKQGMHTKRREEKLSSTNHPQLGTKEQAKPHKMCHYSLTYTDPAEQRQKKKNNLVTVSSLPRSSLLKEGEWAGVDV